MFYGEVFKALSKANVKYVVAGGTAVALHGYERFTQDLDLIVYLENKNLGKLFEVFGKIGYVPKVPVTREQFQDKKQRRKWEVEKGMVVFSFVKKDPPFQLVDVFIKHPIRFDLLSRRRQDILVEGIIIPIAGIDDLIKIKQKAGRDVDLNDIVQLKAIKKLRSKND